MLIGWIDSRPYGSKLFPGSERDVEMARTEMGKAPQLRHEFLPH